MCKFVFLGETFVTRKITRAIARIVNGHQEYVELGNLDSQRDWGHAKDYIEVSSVYDSERANIISKLMFCTSSCKTMKWISTFAYCIIFFQNNSIANIFILVILFNYLIIRHDTCWWYYYCVFLHVGYVAHATTRKARRLCHIYWCCTHSS